jgi:GNAT-like C-terminal domain
MDVADEPGGFPGRVGQEWDASWRRLVASGGLHRVGRLEFAPMRWPHPFRWFRHRESGDTVLVAGDGVPFTADGYLVDSIDVGGSADDADRGADWVSEYVQGDGDIVAHPVWPTGRMDRGRVRLPLSQWEQLLGPGEPVLDVHVPEDGGRLTPDVLHDTLAQADLFFARHHPEHPFVAFFCASWLFGPQLPEILGENSGIIRWQREGYLCPDRGRPGSVLHWVFGSRSVDLATAPRDTRLRAGLVELMRAGRTLRTGRWLFARQDLARFGEQPYRHASARAIREAMLDRPVTGTEGPGN